MWKLILLCLPYLCLAENSESLAPFIEKCKWDDPICIRRSAIKAKPYFIAGIPELNVEPMDPMTIDYINASTPDLKLILTNAVLTGLKDCEINSITRELLPSRLSMALACTLHMDAKYEMDGRVLTMPIDGKGDHHSDVNNVQVIVDAITEVFIGNDGKKHWKLQSWKYEYELVGKSELHFDNLYPGRPVMRASANQFISNNANAIIRDIGGACITAYVDKVFNNIDNFFYAVPLEDLVFD